MAEEKIYYVPGDERKEDVEDRLKKKLREHRERYNALAQAEKGS